MMDRMCKLPGGRMVPVSVLPDDLLSLALNAGLQDLRAACSNPGEAEAFRERFLIEKTIRDMKRGGRL